PPRRRLARVQRMRVEKRSTARALARKSHDSLFGFSRLARRPARSSSLPTVRMTRRPFICLLVAMALAAWLQMSGRTRSWRASRRDARCDDGDPCTLDRCAGTTCVHERIPGGARVCELRGLVMARPRLLDAA